MASTALQRTANPTPSLDCGRPIDCQYFDRSNIVALPAVGATVVLARIELPQQYCGTLEYFSQYSDLFSRDPSEVLTHSLLWQIRANGQPLSPYHQLNVILNPWGFGSFQVALRLPEGAVLELIARRTGEAVASPGKQLNAIGGRLVGRYWYNSAYGAQQ
jgi:hypothetical protein